jgi:hypothetical protein
MAFSCAGLAQEIADLTPKILAVARENGSIELWYPSANTWYLKHVRQSFKAFICWQLKSE